MSYLIITKMAYNAETRQIETWQHSNNVWPRTDYFYSFDATEDNLFNLVKWVAGGDWHTRKWAKAFNTLFAEYPELIARHDNNFVNYDDHHYMVYLANVEAWRNRAAIVARFRELTNIA